MKGQCRHCEEDLPKEFYRVLAQRKDPLLGWVQVDRDDGTPMLAMNLDLDCCEQELQELAEMYQDAPPLFAEEGLECAENCLVCGSDVLVDEVLVALLRGRFVNSAFDVADREGSVCLRCAQLWGEIATDSHLEDLLAPGCCRDCTKENCWRDGDPCGCSCHEGDSCED